MNLDEAQKKIVAGWVAEGLKLSDIQKRLFSELGLTVTYMEVRFLVDDLKLTPKDVEPPKAPSLPTPAPAGPGTGKAAPVPPERGAPVPDLPRAGGSVSVTVDTIARPGTAASGKVTFSDGQRAEWYLDQTGRLGLSPQQQGYRPAQADVLAFQTELQNQLAKFGY